MYWETNEAKMSDLIGHTFEKITKDLTFFENGKPMFVLEHHQDGCEDVEMTDIDGDLEDITGSKILEAYETSKESERGDERWEWHFYHIRTMKGSVTIAFRGHTESCYSLRAELYRI